MILEAKFGASDFPLENHYLIKRLLRLQKIAVRDGLQKKFLAKYREQTYCTYRVVLVHSFDQVCEKILQSRAKKKKISSQ